MTPAPMTPDRHDDTEAGLQNAARDPALDAAREALRSQERARRDDDALASLRASIGQARAAEEASLGGRLRALSTPTRALFALIIVFVAVSAVAAITPRPDLGMVPILRMAGVAAAMVAVIASAVRLATWPMHRPEPRHLWPWLLVGGVIAPVLLAVLPEAHTGHAASLGGRGDALLPAAARCYAFGTALAVPVLLVMRLFDRTGHVSWWRALLAAVAAGMAGDLALQMHCPMTSVAHLVLGHASVVVVLLAVYAITHAVASRRRASN